VKHLREDNGASRIRWVVASNHACAAAEHKHSAGERRNAVRDGNGWLRQ